MYNQRASEAYMNTLDALDGPFQIVDGNPPLPVVDQTRRSYYAEMMEAVRLLRPGTHLLVKVNPHSDVSPEPMQRALVRNIRVALKRFFPNTLGWHPKVMAMSNVNEVSIFRPEVTTQQAMQSLSPKRRGIIEALLAPKKSATIRVSPAANQAAKCIYCRSSIHGRAQTCLSCHGTVCLECGPTLSECPTMGCKATW